MGPQVGDHTPSLATSLTFYTKALARVLPGGVGKRPELVVRGHFSLVHLVLA